MKKIPVIIDCDPGVDDSYAIALAASNPEFEIVALTAVEGNVPASMTCHNCMGLREALGIVNAKVAYGAERPIEKAYSGLSAAVHGEGGVGGIQFPEFELEPDPREAWDLIYDEAVRLNGELVLFAVGPLTNIAIALRKYPDLPKYIKKFVLMGGGTYGNVRASGGRAEFNIWVDPLAAKEVFEKLEVWMIGLNATMASAINAQDFDEMLDITSRGNSRECRFIHELTEFSKENSIGRGRDNNVIHDALAVATQMDPAVVEFEKYYVYVEDGEAENNGETVIDLDRTSGKEPNCWVAMKVDQPRFAGMIKDMCRYYAGERSN